MSDDQGNVVRLTAKNWIGLIVLAVSVTFSSMGYVEHRISRDSELIKELQIQTAVDRVNLQKEMILHDQKCQERTERIVREIRQELKR